MPHEISSHIISLYYTFEICRTKWCYLLVLLFWKVLLSSNQIGLQSWERKDLQDVVLVQSKWLQIRPSESLDSSCKKKVSDASNSPPEYFSYCYTSSTRENPIYRWSRAPREQARKYRNAIPICQGWKWRANYARSKSSASLFRKMKSRDWYNTRAW